MKIVLVRPPFIDIKYGPPIGLAFLSQVLKDEGHEVTIFDINLEIKQKVPQEMRPLNLDNVLSPSHPAYRFAYDRFDTYCQYVLDQGPDLVGFHLTYSSMEYGSRMAAQISKHVRCIAGGPQASFNEEDLLNLGPFDTVVSGYGEEAVLQALDSRGIIFKNLENSRDYSPDYSEMDLDKYNRILPVVTTRGCPHRCHFCTQHYPYYYHSIDSVVQQVREAPELKKLMFNDSNLNINAKRTEKLFTELAKLDKKPFGHVFGMEIEKHFGRYISKMAEAGVREARLGIESGAPRERDSMNKHRFSNQLVKDFIKELTDNKIMAIVQFIFCYPDQTEKDREETLALVNQVNETCDMNYVKHVFNTFVVHHGTEEFFRKQFGVICRTPSDWHNSLYNPGKIKKLREAYAQLLPENAKIDAQLKKIKN